MPESRARRRARAPSRRRDKSAEARARETQAAQKQAETRKMTLAAYRRWRILGWTLVGMGVIVGVQHLISHLGVFNLISPGVDDIVVGYPMAGALGVAGILVLSKT
jgi:hypothetical protein